MSALGDRLAARFGYARIQQGTIEVRDDAYWRQVGNASPLARRWVDVRQAIERTEQAISENPLAVRLLELVADFVIGDGVRVEGDPWAAAFFDHKENGLGQRLRVWLMELGATGDLYLVLSRNKANGMSYVREVPSVTIDEIVVDDDDMRHEYGYHQTTADLEGKNWLGRYAPQAVEADQVMLHYKIGERVGDPRGRGDLDQVCTWLERYDQWLEDRVRINRFKGALLWHVSVTNPKSGEIDQILAKYTRPPRSGSIIVSSDREIWEAMSPKIEADDAESDGKAIRLMIAAGVGVPLHFLSEGETATRATAKEMGVVTYRRMLGRQLVLQHIITDVIEFAAQRAGHVLSESFEVRMSAIDEPIFEEEHRTDDRGAATDSE